MSIDGIEVDTIWYSKSNRREMDLYYFCSLDLVIDQSEIDSRKR